MRKFNPSTLAAVGLALALGVSLGVIELRHTPATPARSTTKLASVSPDAPIPPTPVAQPEPMREKERVPAAPQAKAQTNPPGTLTVSQVFPGIQQPVTNWKNFKPNKITIAPYPDLPVEFEVSSVTEQKGRTVWTGRNALEGAFLVSAATENQWEGTLVVPPAGAFEIHVEGERVTITEKNHEFEVCGSSPSTARDLPTSDVAPSASSDTAVAEADTNSVDVLFFYDADTLAQLQNSASAFETRMISYIASANAALVNSNVTNFHWRYLASYPIPAYTATNSMENDLDVITGVNGNAASAPTAVSDFVTAKATLHGADQVVLYVGGTRDYAGIAWTGTGTGANQANLRLQFHTAVVEWNTSYMTLAHELGHNFGCNHDRQTENAPDNDGQYHYGFRFQDRSNRDTGTIMSYAASRLPYYSNPLITFNGYVLGVAEGQPKAANNSRILTDGAQSMIISRAAIDPPTITTQPQSVTITEGQSFTLSVVATGPNITYQWRHAGVDISGATAASYAKTGATSSTDAGAYNVVVSDIAGQTSSSDATVTINPVPAAAAPAPAPASSGGGGGAFDSLFACLCAGYVIVQCRSRK